MWSPARERPADQQGDPLWLRMCELLGIDRQ